MSDYTFKNHKQIEIIKEMVKVGSRYEINGVNLSLAYYMYRNPQELFQVIPPGSYTITQEGGNTYLDISDAVILSTALEFQVIYVYDVKSSQYIDPFPDLVILQNKYNELQDDFSKLVAVLKSNNISGDTMKMFYVLPKLNEGEVWLRTADGWKGTNVADLELLVQELEDKINNEIIPKFEEDVENIIDDKLKADYIDIPYLNKDVALMYLDDVTNTLRECDNTKAEPKTGVGLKFTKDDGTIVTRVYFRGKYELQQGTTLTNGVYWQDPTTPTGLTLNQPSIWKSQAFEVLDGYIYTDTGNPILLQGQLGTIVFKEYETLEQARASQLIDGEYVIVTGDVISNDGGQGIYQKVNGVFEIRDFNRSFLGQKLDKQDTINDLINSTQYVIGDVVEVLGFYTKGDGSNHKRVLSLVSDESGIQGNSNFWWNIVQDGEVNVNWFGAKGDGINDDTDSIKKALNYESVFIPKKTYIVTSTLTINKTVKGNGTLKANVPGISAITLSGDKVFFEGITLESFSNSDGSIGIFVDKIYNSSIKNINIIGFTRNYVTSEGVIGGSVSNSVVENVKVYNGFNGFEITKGFQNEYITYNSCFAVKNSNYGVKMIAGNVNWTGGSIEQNGIGIYMEHDENSQHSSFVGVNVNHNINYNLHVKGVYNGHNFIACNFHDNTVRWKGILLEDCRGINIIGGNIGCDIEYRKTEGPYKPHQGFCSIKNNFIVKDVDVLNTGRENLFLDGNYKGLDQWVHNDNSLQFVYSYLSSRVQIVETLTNLKFDVNEDLRLSNNSGTITTKVRGIVKIKGRIAVLYNQITEIQQDRVTIYRKTKGMQSFDKLYECYANTSGISTPGNFDINFEIKCGEEDEIIIRYEKSGSTVEVFEVSSFYSIRID